MSADEPRQARVVKRKKNPSQARKALPSATSLSRDKCECSVVWSAVQFVSFWPVSREDGKDDLLISCLLSPPLLSRPRFVPPSLLPTAMLFSIPLSPPPVHKETLLNPFSLVLLSPSNIYLFFLALARFFLRSFACTRTPDPFPTVFTNRLERHAGALTVEASRTNVDYEKKKVQL